MDTDDISEWERSFLSVVLSSIFPSVVLHSEENVQDDEIERDDTSGWKS